MAQNGPNLDVLPPVSRFLVRRRTFFSWALPLVLLVVAAPWGPLMLPGAMLVVLGSATRVWAAGHLLKSERLAVDGPFAYVRNPLYLGSLLILLGYCTLSGRAWSYPVFLGLFALFYFPTIKWEEGFLGGKFGEEYQDYRRRVPYRLIPRLSPAYPTGTGFSWAQARRNGELSGVALAVIMILLFYLRLVM
jgi:protein-S-isoprenylcysteine O-methyltransferase Ste14